MCGEINRSQDLFNREVICRGCGVGVCWGRNGEGNEGGIGEGIWRNSMRFLT